MSLGGLIPIGGGGGGGGAKKANDLTSGLISISAPKGGGASGVGDLDMSDFDVDDLLSDTAGGAKTKAKAATSPTAKDSRTKKKSSSSSKSKDKDSSKKKSKKKKTSALDDSADNDDLDGDSNDWGGGSSKSKPAAASKWSVDDDSTEFDAVPVKKKGNLDAEFAKMLGLDDDFGADSSMATATRAEDDDGDRIESFGARDGGDKSELVSSSKENDESDVLSFSYEPRVRGKSKAGASSIFDDAGGGGGGSGKSYSDPFAARTEAARKSSGGDGRDTEAADEAVGGLSASFFQNEPSGARQDEGDADDPFGGSSLSFLSSTSERRGGRGGGGGRRGGGSSAPVIEDPFAKRSGGAADPFGAKGDSDRPASALDSLFGSSREKKESGGDDGDRFSGSKAQDEATGTARVGGRRQSQQQQHRANDGDLFAELFPPEPAASALKSTTTKTPLEPSPPKRDLMAELFPSEPASTHASKSAATEKTSREELGGSSPTLDKDSRSARDDLLADLLPSKPPRVSTTTKDDLLAELLPSKPARSSPTLDKDSRSAKDDLLAELSPPKSAKPPPTSGKDSRPAKDDLLAELSLAKASPTRNYDVRNARDNLLAELSPPKTPKAHAELSPGTPKTLAPPSMSSIKEADFEQSKDSLLEELLAPPSPSRRGASSPRRSSYSQSFEDEDERRTAPESPRRHRIASSAASSPPQSPAKGQVDALTLHERSDVPERRQESSEYSAPAPPAPSPSPPAKATPTVAAPEDRRSHEVSRELLEEALRARGDELRAESEAATAALVDAHASEVARLNAVALELTQQLSDAQTKHQALVGESMQRQSHVSLLEQEKVLLTQQIASLQTEKQQLQQDLHALRMQHAVCETQSALFESERAGFVDQVKSLEEQTRQLVRQVSQAKHEHQATQLQFASFQQEKEQEASLHKQREAHDMRQLYQQLQTSLVSLKMLQEQVVGEELTKHEVESESRLRMITSLETSSRRSAQQAEDECVRLASLLNSLETTLRHSRQEHLEEKERLRQEQLRLNVLAAHFQAQTSVLHEKADANSQVLAQHLASSLQDVRVAEARLAARRASLEDGEKQLYDERTRFAVYREEFLQQQAREAHKAQSERAQLDAKWKQLARERADLDAVIASHEDEFQQLQEQTRALDDERARVECHARQVAAVATKFEALTQQLLAREDALAGEKQALDAWKLEVGAKQQSVASERQALDERELRLRSQLKQMEKARQRLNSQRKEFLSTASREPPSSANLLAAHDLDQAKRRLLEHTRYMGGARGVRDVTMTPAPVDNNRKWRRTSGADALASSSSSSQAAESGSYSTSTTAAATAAPQVRAFTPNVDPPIWNDPSGLSPAFRQLVEDNWKQREWSLGVADAALHKERMWISCIGLDTRRTTPTDDGNDAQLQQRSAAPATAASRGPKSAAHSTPAASKHQVSAPTSHRRTPPPPLSTLPPRRAVTIDL